MGDYYAMLDWMSLFIGIGLAALRGRHALLVENLLLRQQLAVALRAHPRQRLGWQDRLFWIVAGIVTVTERQLKLAHAGHRGGKI